MAELETAKSAGFCFGVEKAVNTVYSEIGKSRKIYTYGPIIHNENVVEDLRKQGVGIAMNEDDIVRIAEECRKDCTPATVIIRSHGVPKKTLDFIREQGLDVIDATCPFVARIHRIVEEESAKGSQIVIIGNAGHAEVEGTMGWSCSGASVIETKEEAQNFTADPEKPVTIVAQTTFSMVKFDELVDILMDKGYNTNVVNTICNATRQRQEEARAIASRSDVMIVIGGRNSSNSAKLCDICRGVCPETYFIQTVRDLPVLDLGSAKVGITAGASTPKNIIEEVQNYVRTGRREF